MYLLNNYIVRLRLELIWRTMQIILHIKLSRILQLLQWHIRAKKTPSIREFLISCLEKNEKTIKVKFSFAGLTFCNSDLLFTVYVAYNNSFSTSFPGVSNVYPSEAIILKWMSCYFVFFKLWKFSYCDQCLYFNTFLIKVVQELKDFGLKNSLCSKLVFIRGTNKWPCRKRNHKAPISRKCLSTS